MLLPLDEKKSVLQIVIAFEFKNRAEKNTFAAHGESSRADLLETAAVREVQGPSACLRKVLGRTRERWHPGQLILW